MCNRWMIQLFIFLSLQLIRFTNVFIGRETMSHLIDHSYRTNLGSVDHRVLILFSVPHLFSVAAPNRCNSLRDNVTSANTVMTFCRHFKTFLIAMCFCFDTPIGLGLPGDSGTIRVSAFLCIVFHCIALYCIAFHFIAFHCISLHFIALHCTFCNFEHSLPIGEPVHSLTWLKNRKKLSATELHCSCYKS